MKKFRKVLVNVFATSFMVSILSLISAIVLTIVAFTKYTDCFFTTSSNYIALEKAAPTLNKAIIIGWVICMVGALICISCKKLANSTQKRYR